MEDISQPHSPSEEPKPHAKKPKKSKKKWFFGILGILIIALAAGGWWFFKIRDTGPIPKSIQKSVSFAIYYPSSLPASYHLDSKSVKFQTQVLFFNFINGTSKIAISEQTAPQNPPDFSALMKFNTTFKSLNYIGGKAIYGTSQKQPVAFLLTNTTLVNIISTKNVPLDTIAKITESLTPQ